MFFFSRKLKLIDLTGNEITDRGMEDISNQMEQCKKIKVKTIKFASNSISNRGATSFLEAMLKNESQIEELSFADNGLSEQFAKNLAEYLKIRRQHYDNYVIKKFELGGNGIGPEGVALVEKELLRNKHE